MYIWRDTEMGFNAILYSRNQLNTKLTWGRCSIGFVVSQNIVDHLSRFGDFHLVGVQQVFSPVQRNLRQINEIIEYIRIKHRAFRNGGITSKIQ